MVSLRKFAVHLIILGSFVSGPQASADPGKEFIMSCTYGVLAGTLVGAATLAFEDKPGDNLQRIARGASLGLYAGIALGFYTVYVLPGKLQEEDEYRRSLIGADKNPVKFFPIAYEDGAGMGLNFRF